MSAAGIIGLFVAAAGAATALAPNPFDGNWRTDPSTLRADVPPIVLELRGGSLTCRSCRPPYTVKADGGFHPVSGRTDADASAVTVLDARHLLKIDRFHGRVTLRETFVVSADGRSAELDLVDSGVSGQPPKTTRQTLTRVSSTAGGETAISGVWRVRPDAVRRDAAIVTLQVTGNALKVTTSNGQSSISRLDGGAAAVEGRAGVDAISVRRLSARALVETDLLKGRPVSTYRLTVLPDGREMNIEIKDLVQGATMTQIARKF